MTASKKRKRGFKNTFPNTGQPRSILLVLSIWQPEFVWSHGQRSRVKKCFELGVQYLVHSLGLNLTAALNPLEIKSGLSIFNPALGLDISASFKVCMVLWQLIKWYDIWTKYYQQLEKCVMSSISPNNNALKQHYFFGWQFVDSLAIAFKALTHHIRHCQNNTWRLDFMTKLTQLKDWSRHKDPYYLVNLISEGRTERNQKKSNADNRSYLNKNVDVKKTCSKKS